MTSRNGPSHVVVDGSNIATEGRSLPSLAQLSEAVESFMEDHPDTAITVVVDATFGHRIDKKEVAEFEAGISNNELVAPPAGAVGRGDAFVLSIAEKANASILSNDSFQEFHADYEWLFDEGRLIGGKPVPHVGWVFVDRVPVRGPVSRKATLASRGRGGSRRSDGGRTPGPTRSGSPLANEPMPVPKTPPPRGAKAPIEAPVGRAPAASTSVTPKAAPRAGEVVNELMPFLEFVEHHPVGTSVNGTVESYSSHGAYISIGDDGVRGYIPLRLMADPAPTSARKMMQLGEAVTVVVVSFAAARRSIDCALPDMVEHVVPDAGAALIEAAVAQSVAATPRRPRKVGPATQAANAAPVKAPAVAATAKMAAGKKTAARTTVPKTTAAKTTAPKTSAAKTSAAKTTAPKTSAAKTSAAKTSAAKTSAAKTSAAKTSAPKTIATTTAATKTATSTAAAQTTAPKTTAPKTTAPTTAKRTAAKKTAVKQTNATRIAPNKIVPTKAAAESVPDKSAPDKSASAESAPDKIVPTKAAAKSAPAKIVPTKAAAKSTPAKKSAPAKKIEAAKKAAAAKPSATSAIPAAGPS